MGKCEAFCRRSLEQREAFWAEQAGLIDWYQPFDQVLDYSRPPFARWFVGGRTNLCHNAIDRHLPARASQTALIYVSTEVDQQKIYTYQELHAEVQRTAAMLRELGVGTGDRVLIYMPMIPEAVIAMLATVRLGAIHSVVFGGFAAHSLATRIDDARPKVMLTADAGSRNGRILRYKPLIDEALRLSADPPESVVVYNRGLDPALELTAGRDLDWATLRARHAEAEVPCAWVESNDPSYILYTSGTTGIPKGVQRDTAGHAVALAASMKHIYDCRPGETYFATSDIGWVVGHSYIVYGPLINGSATVLYEGLPVRPDPGIWWKIVQDHRVSVMFSSPTGIRVLKTHDSAYLRKYDLTSLRHLFLAGEPLDEPTARWITEALEKPVYDHYWQTETGWPLITPLTGVESTPVRFGSPCFAAYGYDVRLLREDTGEEIEDGEKGVVCVVPPLPPGCMTTVWGRDEHFVQTYFTRFKDRQVYATFDWGVRDDDGYYFILGRADDVINVAGHRIGTREIEEAVISHPAIAEAAVVGVADSLKGQIPLAFAVVRDPAAIAGPEAREQLTKDVLATVDRMLGAIARPGRLFFVAQLPKTRSGKLMRRSIKAIVEGRSPGDVSTLDDPAGMEHIAAAVRGRTTDSIIEELLNARAAGDKERERQRRTAVGLPLTD
jgi:propionyl-CoA synthetase